MLQSPHPDEADGFLSGYDAVAGEVRRADVQNAPTGGCCTFRIGQPCLESDAAAFEGLVDEVAV